MVPPSIIRSSFLLSVSQVTGQSPDCASESGPWRACASSPSLWTEAGMFDCTDIGMTTALLNSDWWSIALQVASLHRSDSTGFCSFTSMLEAILMLFSSNFPENAEPGPGPGPEPLFMAWEWLTKLWTLQWLFLCFKYKNRAKAKHKQLKRKREQEEPKIDYFRKMKKQRSLHQHLQVKPKDKPTRI